MRTNEYGQPLDSNGYAPSILQGDLTRCWRCKRTGDKLDRHEVFGGVAYRQKSKRLGLWVMLCHNSCHCGANGVHYNVSERLYLKSRAQRAAMMHYGWSEDDFIREFGKNYLE